MLIRRFGLFLLMLLPVLAASSTTVLTPATAWAQTGDDDDDDGGDDIDLSGVSGVVVDPEGVLRRQTFNDRDGRVSRARSAAAKAKLDPKVAAVSPMRKVSLTRLEAALKDRLDRHQGVTDEMKYLAGLTRVEYVFFYPETKDIVIAGPAEPWANDLTGRVRGIETGRPTVLLEDLIVALRVFNPNEKVSKVISVSIDPTKEGLARMQQFMRQMGTNLAPTAENATFYMRGLKESLGTQLVHLTGVPPTTHFAHVLTEADYRMKLIGIGLEKPPVKMASYVSRANPAAVSRNSLLRWYFVPDYECVRASEDGNAMQLVGDGVKLMNANEVVSSDGARSTSSGGDKASKIFVETFTRKYPELAAKSPVYAQLRSLIDLSVLAAFLQKHDIYGKAGWTMPVFSNEDVYAVETYPAAKEVETAVTAVFRGNTWMTPIGGGVVMRPKDALKEENLLKDEDGEVAKARDSVDLSHLQDGQWWWD